MRILVTGADGLLGSALRGKEFVYINRDHVCGDLSNQKRVGLLMDMYKPEVIIHAAAKVGGIKLNSEKPETMFYDNVLMNTMLIHKAATSGVKKFIAFGSTCAGEDGSPYKLNASYGWAKRMLLIHLEAAKKEYGMDYSYLVPVSMFGKHDNFSLESGHVIPSLIHKCYTQKELRVWGDGSPKRQVIYSEDVAKIVVEIIDKDVPQLMIGSPFEVSVKEMVEVITRHTGFTGKVVWETDKPNGQLSRPFVNPYKMDYTPFEKAIQETYKWFKANYPKVRM